jgi:hypothetical protein
MGMTEQLAQCSVVSWLFIFFCLVGQQIPSKDNDEDLTWIVHGSSQRGHHSCSVGNEPPNTTGYAKTAKDEAIEINLF